EFAEEIHKFIAEQLQTSRVPLCINPQSAAFKSFASFVWFQHGTNLFTIDSTIKMRCCLCARFRFNKDIKRESKQSSQLKCVARCESVELVSIVVHMRSLDCGKNTTAITRDISVRRVAPGVPFCDEESELQLEMHAKSRSTVAHPSELPPSPHQWE
ncbi:hypothetical protein MSG28_003216, partial [Choristoneura fumiferana]